MNQTVVTVPKYGSQQGTEMCFTFVLVLYAFELLENERNSKIKQCYIAKKGTKQENMRVLCVFFF